MPAEDATQVYQPESDTYLLLKCAIAAAKPADTILEIGTGSGLIAHEMSKISEKTFAVDINPHACIAARKLGLEVIRSDLFSALKNDLKFTLVLFNPPYLPTRPEERIDDWLEYALDGGITGRSTIEKFADGLGAVMDRYGRCLLLISSLTGINEVSACFKSRGFISFVIAEERLEDETLYVLQISRDLCSL
ncbi:MAG: methyltransferase [Methanomicrobium sp.]|nr:methyltransferase [Methanomicrobium sp.]MBQ3718849.1 methyltransferase [Methanomicrobium sp.]MBQ4415694.1 methyltransferase [Methanomicrobium sp.]